MKRVHFCVESLVQEAATVYSCSVSRAPSTRPSYRTMRPEGKNSTSWMSLGNTGLCADRRVRLYAHKSAPDSSVCADVVVLVTEGVRTTVALFDVWSP